MLNVLLSRTEGGFQWNMSSGLGSYTNTNKKGIGDEMNYIGFWEYSPEDFDKVIELFRQATVEREKGTGKFPKILFPSHGIGGEHKGFTVYENATPEQLTNLVLHYTPVMKFKILPIFESAKVVELYQKMKK